MGSLLLKLARRIKATGILSRSPVVGNWLRRYYGIALNVLYGRHGMPITVGDDRFRVAVASRTMVSSYEGERAVYEALARRIGKGMTIFDIGANEGIFTLCAARRVGPGGRVICFEPAPEALRLLSQNIHLNGFDSRIHIVAKLVGDGCGPETFWVSGKSGYNSQSREGAPEDAEPIQVETVSVDAFVEATRRIPDVVKIDVEGAELRVLRGMETTLKRNSAFVLCEIHFALLRFFDASERDILAFIKKVGYGIYDLRMQPIGSLRQHVILAK